MKYQPLHGCECNPLQRPSAAGISRGHFFMIQEIYNQYKELGLKVIPIEWDEITNNPKSHREWKGEDLPLFQYHNAIMVSTGNGWGALDFDLKNTKNKQLFSQWMDIVNANMPDVLSKLFIEKTRSGGYHVWMKYAKFPHKTQLAQSDEGAEVIAVYCNGPLVYTYPTPNYTEVHQSMSDVEELNDDEYNYLIEVSQWFNEYKPKYDPNKKAISYPVGYEKELLNYDTNISDEGFESLLELIGLVPISGYRYNKKDKFSAYRRKGSESKGISAKVYTNAKRVLIFSSSMVDFPNWHNKEEYPTWSLPPSFILYYHLNREWGAVLNYIGVKKNSEIKFPFEIYPENIRKSLIEVSNERSMSPEFLATAGLWVISSLAGSAYVSDIGGGKNILFCFLVAPMSVGKSPAYEVMCENPMAGIVKENDAEFSRDYKAWEARKLKTLSEKQPFLELPPKRHLPFLRDGSIEGYISLCMDQEAGIGVYIDEAEEIMNAGSYKKDNNSISFFTQAFNGGRFVQSRADRSKERVVKNMNINLLMGTQTERLSKIFTQDKIHSGFASRFLMCEADYKLLNTDSDPFSKKREIHQDWVNLIGKIYDVSKRFNEGNMQPIKIEISEDAKDLYRTNYKLQLQQANERITNRLDGFILGTYAKMSNYISRLTQVVAIMQNPMNPVITKDVVKIAHDLYLYYTETTIRLIGDLYKKSETGLPDELQNLYEALPDDFTKKEAIEICKRLNLPVRKFESSLRNKSFESLFFIKGRGVYTKKH